MKSWILTKVDICRNSALSSFLQEQNISAAEIIRRHEMRQRAEMQQARRRGIEGSNEGEASDEEGVEPIEEGAEGSAMEAEGTASIVIEGENENEGDDSLITEAQAVVRRSVEGPIPEKQSTKKRKRGKKAKGGSGDDGDDDGDINIPSSNRRARLKRTNFTGSDSDDSVDSDILVNASRFHDEENNEDLFRQMYEGQGRIPGQTDFCASCHCKFTVSMTSEPAPPHLQADGSQHLLLCPSCTKEMRDKGKAKKTSGLSLDAIIETRMQRKRVAAALLDRKEFTVPSLLDTCISLVSTHIDDVDALGDIGLANQDRLARILSRNRSLNSKTLKLFLDPTAKKLEFWDCSEVNEDSLMLIPAYCPKLETLTLSMCGQITNKVLSYCSTNLKDLKSISLDGAFLVTAQAWADFFLSMTGRLERLDIRNTHRLDSESLAVLVEACPQLTHLTLHRLSGLTDPAAFLMLPLLSNLVHLDLSHPPQDVVMGGDIDLITDETMTVILNSLGAQLQSLVLDGCSELSDTFVTNALRPCCCGSRLYRLSLASLDKITDSAVGDLFMTWSKRHDPSLTRLTTVCFDRCFSLGDIAMEALLTYIRPAVVQLSIASLPDVSLAPFQNVFIDKPKNSQFPNLTGANFSFVRAISNQLIEGLLERSPNLEYIEVFGVPKVNKACKIRPGLKIIGRQDEI